MMESNNDNGDGDGNNYLKDANYVKDVENTKHTEHVEHVEQIKKKTPEFNCDKCPKSFKTKQQLQRHLDKKISCIGTIFVCKRCYMPFELLSQLQRHQRKKQICLPFEIDISQSSGTIFFKNQIVNKNNLDSVLNSLLSADGDTIHQTHFLHLLHVIPHTLLPKIFAFFDAHYRYKQSFFQLLSVYISQNDNGQHHNEKVSFISKKIQNHNKISFD